MLFTDGNLGSIDELRRYETAILDLASTEGIDLTAKLALSQEQVGAALLKFLLRNATTSTYLSPQPMGGSPWRSRDPQSAVRSRLNLGIVVFTPEVRRWLTLHTLSLVYSDAYKNQLNDRYLGKWTEYQQEAGNAQAACYEFGVGIVQNPIPQPALPVFSGVPGTATGGLFWVEITWTDATGVESNPSALTSFKTSSGNLLEVQPPNPPAMAVGWNVYAGTLQSALSLQNSSPIAAGAPWVMPQSGLVSGRSPGAGQAPDYFVTNVRVLPRG